MKIRAAVAWEPNKSLSIEEVDLEFGANFNNS
jgi:Zn-dependent alcohol dehydrogenase